MSKNIDFYRQIPSVSEFIDVMDLSHFVEAPDDWLVVMTDVRGSTEAIRQGRYREVNILGASGITAVLNAIPNVSFPYVFGGDGATILIPESVRDKAEEALRRVQKMSQQKFGLLLRVGLVPLHTLKKMGFSIYVAKYELSEGNVLAQFAGGGVSKAEELIKKDSEGLYSLAPKTSMSPPNLAGLSCRLAPFASKKGTMLTLLVTVLGDAAAASKIYLQILKQIENILGHSLKGANPVTHADLKWKWPPSTVWIEAKSQANSWNFPLIFFKILLRTLISHFLLNGARVVGGFDPTKYKKELLINTDYTKFDDVLRMVVDCSHSEADKVEAYLEELRQRGNVRYGIHRSPQALMTCMVFSASENRHLHFVDGSHGGYAMAAVGLKSQKNS